MSRSVLADTVLVYVNDNLVPKGLIESVSVETALDKEDMITLVVLNPFVGTAGGQTRTSQLRFSDATAFIAGQPIEVRFVQEGEELSLARGIIQEWLPVFPESGLPTITLKAFGAGVLMMDGTPTINAKDARVFEEGLSLSDIVDSIASDYGFESDVEMLFDLPERAIVKKAGMSDYQFVRGLANLVGHDFFIKWSQETKKFVLTWKEGALEDSFKTSFVWGPDYKNGTGGLPLLSFEPSFAVNGTSTNVEVFYYDQDGGVWEKIVHPPRQNKQGEEESSELQWVGDPITGEDVKPTSVEDDLAQVGGSDTARGLRIKVGGLAVEVVPAQGLKTAEDAIKFAESWFKQRQRSLLLGKGRIWGSNWVRAGQVHTLLGLGAGLSGDWYLTEVNHDYSGGVYSIDFVCRKVIT